jgi:hypothetical protein
MPAFIIEPNRSHPVQFYPPVFGLLKRPRKPYVSARLIILVMEAA